MIETKLNNLEINELTKKQFDSVKESGELNPIALYMTPSSESVIIPISQGGTNAQTAGEARINLGFEYGSEAPTHIPETGDGAIYFKIDDDDNGILPIEEGGTGAITGHDALTNLGTIDYIVEQDTSGNWYYRKWNSGVVELWGSFTQSATAYAKNGFVVGSNALTKYPFAITEPIAQATGRKIGSGIGYLSYDYERVDYWSGIINAPADQGIAAGTTMSVSYYVHVFAKWK